MLDPIALLVIGCGVGAFGTLVGAGGGFLLVPLLALLEPSLRPEAITAISLAVVAFNASSGAFAYARQRRVDFHSGIPFAIATLPGSIVGALVIRYVARDLFDIVFAVLLVALAVFVVVAHEDEPQPAPEGGGWGHVLRMLTDASGTDYRYRVNMPLGAALSALVGLLSSFLGIGGGVIHVPALVGLLRFPTHIATATSHFVLAVMATVGTLTHILSGDLDGLVLQTVLLGAGAVAGAQVGARVSTHVQGVFIVRALALSLAFVGLRLAAQALFNV
ncbi:MAG TPA: sulfite exporter TauE/SafE family protein [Candidatus Limnocylindria bacterium]|nr:sulfite exporter TauE/SafE family protein [Candidatus Limnocylindria bacterium]